jgi:predicted nucleotide-binding protein (sugar kinase/HSP70/actin superfamily)
MARKTENLTVRCPCCEAVLTVHGTSGEVLFTEKPKKKGVSFEDALQQLQREKETADDRFREAFAKEETRKKTVEDKFQEALKRKDELEEPIRPLDWD